MLRPSELEARFGRGEPLFVLDIRPAANYRTGGIDRRHNVPASDSFRRGDFSPLENVLAERPTDQEVVVSNSASSRNARQRF
jgi:rhodanese-related sulfurtransferase